ncbi:MAG: GNAT family N-acetyltransferase [Marinilabiliaceae bacterium]|nr:GNAT family N-acetyltransferase [Marinilabiliaceae bacterium]
MHYPISLYQPDDLEVLCGFLNRSWEYDAITPELLEEKLTGDPFWMPQAIFICRDQEQIIGFMQGVMRNIRGIRYGYIKLMAIDEGYRRQGIATALYQKLEAVFKQQKVEVIRIYDVPLNYWMPGIDPRYTPALCWAMRKGFKRFGDTANLHVDLSKNNWETKINEEKLIEEGIEVRRAYPEDKQAVLDFIQDEWALWRHEAEMAFQDSPPSIHIALMEGKVKAFSAHNANNKGTGWFGPMGTHPDLRGKGMGAILLKRCLKDMKAMGLSHSVIPWVGPIDFYAWHAGAVVDRVFWRFEKILDK